MWVSGCVFEGVRQDRPSIESPPLPHLSQNSHGGMGPSKWMELSEFHPSMRVSAGSIGTSNFTIYAYASNPKFGQTPMYARLERCGVPFVTIHDAPDDVVKAAYQHIEEESDGDEGYSVKETEEGKIRVVWAAPSVSDDQDVDFTNADADNELTVKSYETEADPRNVRREAKERGFSNS